MTEKICPVCNRSNLSTAKRCWYCQSLLEDEPGSGPIAEGGHGTPGEAEKGEDEVPEWLARVRQRKAIEQMQQTKSLSPESIPPQEEPVPPPENQPEEALESKPAPQEPEGAPLPSWLEGLGTHLPTEGVTKSLQPEKASEPESSSWLEKLQSWKAKDEEETESIREQPQEQAEKQAVVPSTEEWLSDFLAPTTEPAGTIPLPQQEIPVDQTGGENKVLDEQETSTPEEAGAQDETYDFSSESEENLAEGQKDLTADQEDSSREANTELPEGFTPVDTQLPSGTEGEPLELLKEEPSANSSDLDWLTHYQEPEPEEPSETEESASQKEITQPLTPFLGVQKSDWGEPVPEPDFEPEREAPAEDVEPAVLPAWMQNLRPIETLPQGDSVETSETAHEGPLAGIEGALVGAGLSGTFEKPALYTNKVQVTDRQSLRADLLQNLLSEPEEAKAVEESRKAVGGKWVKPLVSLLFLAVVFTVLILAPGTSLLPVLFPPETAEAYRLVNELTGDRPVLIAADFEAGLSGEIGFTSQAMLEHLMLRNIPLAVLSTNPVGSTLMEGMLASSQGLVGTYDSATQVVHFGYLSGGSVGIQGLTANLRATLPYDRDLMPAWTNPVLQSVQSLSDLGALIVVTDDADTGRYWIEQVQPAMKGVPLILVTSAQAAPMLQPYYASGQVNAIVAGISGGSAYEQIMKLPGNSSYFFGAYQVLILIVTVLILIGGIFSLLRPVVNGSRG